MKYRLNSQLHIFLGLMLALLLGWMSQASKDVGTNVLPTSINPAPAFQNIPRGWKLTVLFHSSAPPDIRSIARIDQVRIPPENSAGKYSASMLTSDSQVLYIQNFQIYFIRTGVSGKLDSVERIILLPYVDGAVEIKITTPFGDVLYGIPQ